MTHNFQLGLMFGNLGLEKKQCLDVFTVVVATKERGAWLLKVACKHPRPPFLGRNGYTLAATTSSFDGSENETPQVLVLVLPSYCHYYCYCYCYDNHCYYYDDDDDDDDYYYY